MRRWFGRSMVAAAGLCALAACAGHSPPPATVPPGTRAPVTGTTPRKLPRWKVPAHLSSEPYPIQAKREGLTGRTLVEFHLDRDGRPTGIKTVAAEADPLLVSAALQVVRGMNFDVTGPEFDAANPAPFVASVIFCMVPCRNPPRPYPGTESIEVTGSL
jgi:TonB family protein